MDRTISAAEVEAAQALSQHIRAVVEQQTNPRAERKRGQGSQAGLQRGHQAGAYLGGVRCLETLRERCFIEPDTECWRWRLAFKAGVARVWIVLADGSRKHMVGRRAAMFLKTGRELPPERCVFARITCQNRDCVNPEHCRVGTRKEAMAAAVARGDFDTEARRRAVEVALRAHRKLSPEQHREIAMSDVPSPALAKALGMSAGRINAIKRGDFAGSQISKFTFQSKAPA